MSQANQTGTMIRARVLVSGAHGQVDQVIEIESDQVEAMAGIVDTDPASVAYAESLVGHQDGEAPSLTELFGARDALVRRERELDEHAERLAEQKHANQVEAARLKQVADEQAAEAKRLSDESAQLASDKATFEAAKVAPAAAPAPAPGKGKAGAAATP